jgi:hypothetical protein
MPKVSIEGTDSSIKKAPRKRAVRRVVSGAESPVRRVRAAVTMASSATSASVIRKAPARVVVIEKRKLSPKIYVTVIVLILVIGGAAWLGFSDDGQINVNALITERNQKQANDNAARAGDGNDASQTIVVPVQNSASTVPNAGLRGRGVGTPDIASESPIIQTEEATSTEVMTEEAIPAEEVPAEPEVVEGDTPELDQ